MASPGSLTIPEKGRIRCPKCNTPISCLSIETIVGQRLLKKVSEMKQRDEDVYNSEEYETLKLVAEKLLEKESSKSYNPTLETRNKSVGK